MRRITNLYLKYSYCHPLDSVAWGAKPLAPPCLCLNLSQTNQIQLYNDDITELYLVQISGLWGTWALLNTHCSFSYFKTMGTARDSAANWCTRQLLLPSTTHTLLEP